VFTPSRLTKSLPPGTDSSPEVCASQV
jgi:hypothetical protein